MHSVWIALIILAVMAFAFAKRREPYIVAWTGALVMFAFGWIPSGKLFAGLANPTLVLFAALFVIGEAAFRSGLASWLGEGIVSRFGKRERPLLWAIMLAAGIISTFASNTATTAMMLPMVLGICRSAGLQTSRQLMPMAFATGFGGFSALIGTPPNMIVAEALSQAGMRPFRFFEFAWVGIPLALAGMLYMDVARRWLPVRQAHIEEETGSINARPRSTRQIALCASILAAVFATMVFFPKLPLEIVAVAGALLCTFAGCLTPREAIESIEWPTLAVFAGMFAVAEGMQATGLATRLANGMAVVLGAHPFSWAVVAAPFIATMALGTVLSNTACAVLMTPVGLMLAKNLGAQPHPILMGIAVAASCNFLTPTGTPPNLLVWTPGGYRFSDYVKVGAGLSLICLAISLVVIPWRWPLFIAR